MNPPVHLPGQIVYWPRDKSIQVAIIAHAHCYPAIYNSDNTVANPGYTEYALTNGAASIPEDQLHDNWEKAKSIFVNQKVSAQAKLTTQV